MKRRSTDSRMTANLEKNYHNEKTDWIRVVYIWGFLSSFEAKKMKYRRNKRYKNNDMIQKKDIAKREVNFRRHKKERTVEKYSI